MTAFQVFMHMLYMLQHADGPCVAVTQSTHSTPATQYPDVYEGNCLQAFIISLYSHGQIAWEYLPI